MSESFQQKQLELEKIIFSSSQEEVYKNIIEFGKSLPAYPEDQKIPSALVAGCQSEMYLLSTFDNGFIFFTATSNALISAGLAALLVFLYSGESPEVVLKYPPTCLQKLNLSSLLSPSRSSGLASILLRMKQEALQLIVKTKSL